MSDLITRLLGKNLIEVVSSIFLCLNGKDLKSCRLCCKNWNNAVKDIIWSSKKCKRILARKLSYNWTNNLFTKSVVNLDKICHESCSNSSLVTCSWTGNVSTLDLVTGNVNEIAFVGKSESGSSEYRKIVSNKNGLIAIVKFQDGILMESENGAVLNPSFKRKSGFYVESVGGALSGTLVAMDEDYLFWLHNPNQIRPNLNNPKQLHIFKLTHDNIEYNQPPLDLDSYHGEILLSRGNLVLVNFNALRIFSPKSGTEAFALAKVIPIDGYPFRVDVSNGRSALDWPFIAILFDGKQCVGLWNLESGSLAMVIDIGARGEYGVIPNRLALFKVDEGRLRVAVNGYINDDEDIFEVAKVCLALYVCDLKAGNWEEIFYTERKDSNFNHFVHLDNRYLVYKADRTFINREEKSQFVIHDYWNVGNITE